MNEEKLAYVFFSDSEDRDIFVGTITSSFLNGKEIHSFSFDDSYLRSAKNRSFFIDPDLSFYSGRQFVSTGKTTFGFLSDSSPDRWGRLLLQRQETALAKDESRRPKILTEFDYLLGVNDFSRNGALRFKRSLDGPFEAPSNHHDIPPMTSLRELEEASRLIDENKPLDEKRLQLLMAPGSSLGGARPKASVVAPDGSLWIAKFPSKNDRYDVGSFEMVAHDLAKLCSINVAEARLGSFSQYGKTYLSKRFDRKGSHRIPFASAMALLGKTDGENASYLDLVSFITSQGDSPLEDLHELYRRLIFNVVIANTDDHLRNHGFLFSGEGWRLSPAYDLNPSIDKNQLVLSIDEISHDLDLNLVRSLAPKFAIDSNLAQTIIYSIQTAIKNNYYSLTEKYEIPDEISKEIYSYFQIG
jgi:serine/threonine-protein kinase HipA